MSPRGNLSRTQIVVTGPLGEERAANSQHLQIISYSGVHLHGFWLKIYSLGRRRKDLNVTVLIQMKHRNFSFQGCCE